MNAYDISNAAGVAANQPCQVSDQWFDANRHDFTTNWFQAYDVPLTNGVNNITLRASDRAGNVAVTNFSVTLDYGTATNPVIALAWPQDGMQVCGDSFTLRGTADDPAAMVSASITDTNGDVNTVMGEVERSGVLWVENLPLAEGTNYLTLRVTNSAGFSSETNIAVVKNDMTLNLTSISGDLWQPTVNVSGNISDATAAVYVNGVQGTNYGSGTWSAENVPVGAGGVASFDVGASPGGGGAAAEYSTNAVKDAEVVIMKYDDTKSSHATDTYGYWSVSSRVKAFGAVSQSGGDGMFLPNWVETVLDDVSSGVLGGSSSWEDNAYVWSSTNAAVYDRHYTDNGGADGDYTNSLYYDDYDRSITGLPDQDLWGIDAGWVYHYFADNLDYPWSDGEGDSGELKVDAHTQMKLFTGGKAGIGKMSLIQLQCVAWSYGAPSYGSWENVPTAAIPSSSLYALGQQVGGDGNLWVAEPDGASPDLNLNAPGYDHYSAGAVPTKWPVTLTANGTALDPDTVVAGANFCVGQNVAFALGGWPVDGSVVATNFQWTFGGTYFNDQTNAVAGGSFPNSSAVPYVDSSLLKSNVATAWWVSGGAGENTDPNIPAVYSASVTCDLVFTNGSPKQTINVSGLFTMFRPKAIVTTKTGVISLDSNYFLFTTNGTPTTNLFALHYGIPSNPYGTYSTNGMPGIVFTNTVTYPTNFSGDVEWVQVINNLSSQLQLTNSAWIVTGFVTNAMLDNVIPYEPVDFTTAEDSPAQGTTDPASIQAISCSGSFSMWLLFKPTTGNHWVPLQKVNWSWIGLANSSSGLTYANNTINPTGADTIIYPYWTDTYTNK